ncbi:MAG: LTA synthase family protein [Deltaproteobacteria bacterium]|nr:LTA synthase family protein [Deltaproteobacteria bacterium]
MLKDLNLSFSEAWASGFAAGIACDLMAAILPLVLAKLVILIIGRGERLAAIISTFFVWLATLAGALYFSFFQMPLDWWIVRQHWSDLSDVSGSIPALITSPLHIISILLMLLAIVTIAISPPRQTNSRLKTLRQLLIALAISALLWEAPPLMSINDGSPLVKDHILRFWAMQNFRKGLYQGIGMSWTAQLEKARANQNHQAPTNGLLAYRNFIDDPLLANILKQNQHQIAPWYDAADYPRPSTDYYPLLYKTTPSINNTQVWRKQLGLPVDGPIHVIVLFVESFRGFEFDHPQIGQLIFKRLIPLLKRHAIRFKQAYSSSQHTGQTVRGFYSTLCSMLPNMTGPAEYLAFTTLRVKCLQQVLKNAGYLTTYMNSYRATFHQTRLFENLHGVDEFYDEPYYFSQGITQRIGDWGLADGPFLQSSLKLMQQLAQSNKPIFVNASTLSTHHKYSVIPEGPLPDELIMATENHQSYRGFLSRFRYADYAIADFIEALWRSPIGERTLLVMLGDHSVPILPYIELTNIQRHEIQYRITMAMLTKHMKRPQVRNHIAHQIDITPTIAAIIGVNDTVAWLGKNLLVGDGSPWVYMSASGDLTYRTDSHYCSYKPNQAMHCFNTQQYDPLFDPILPKAAAIPQEAELFINAVKANLWSTANNRIMP